MISDKFWFIALSRNEFMTEWLKTTAKGGFRRAAGVFQSRTNERTFMQPFVIQRFEIESTLALFLSRNVMQAINILLS